MKEYLPEVFRSRVLLAPQATDNGAQAYAAPTVGASAITIRNVATMGNATDLVLSLKYADDATGTNATDYPVDVPVYVGGVRQTDAKAYTIGDSNGSFIVDFCVDPATIPEGKFIGVSYGNSNAANLLTTLIVEDVAYKPTATA
jgi:hypothetical protein